MRKKTFFTTGPDPNFPYLDETVYYDFGSPKEWDSDIIAIGGNLSPGMLLSAYEQGIFPWYGPGDPILWQSPDPRCVIFPENLHVSSSMQKIFKKNVYDIRFNTDFEGVIKGCASISRHGQNATWIFEEIIEGYLKLHRLGWAHSAEAWTVSETDPQDGELAGGCYGVLMGGVFVGESMFARKSNASKAAFLTFAEKLFENGLAFVDCQVPTNHLLSLGGEVMPRDIYLGLINANGVQRNNKKISVSDF